MGFIFKDSDNTIIQALNNALIKKYSQGFYDSKNIDIIENFVRTIVINSIKSTKTWQSLSDGGIQGLDAHFGIPRDQVQERLSTLLNIWAREIKVIPQPIKKTLRLNTFAYRFYAIQADWANVLSSPAGITTNISKNSKQGKTATKLPWLEWLLISGDKLTITGYHIDFNNYPKSRSGKALMKPKLTWRIPPGFAPFNTNHNFITQVLEKLAKDEDFRRKMINIFINISGFKGNDSGLFGGDIDI